MKEYVREYVNRHFNIGISCFSEDWQSILMWGHYAQNHTGFCAEYDASHRPFSSATRVVYTKNRPNPKALDLLVALTQELHEIHFRVDDEKFESVKKILQEEDFLTTAEIHSFDHNQSDSENSREDEQITLFYLGKFGEILNDVIRKKHFDWSYEKEWRLFCSSFRTTAEIPRGSLKSITLGLNAEKENIKRLCAACKDYGDIPIYQCKEANNKYGIVRKTINKDAYQQD